MPPSSRPFWFWGETSKNFPSFALASDDVRGDTGVKNLTIPAPFQWGSGAQNL